MSEPGSWSPSVYAEAMEHLIDVVQELSLARDLSSVMRIVRTAARALTGADGASFVLRDGDCCFYADEDAISPLWKGKRFPMEICISGWVMLNRQSVVIEDIYVDPRIPADAYRPTFVKSLAMVPIRTVSPVGAIGNYWAVPRRPCAEQVRLLQALADSTSIALENVGLYADLERRVRERTAELEAANRELETFSYSVSHDLRAPLRAIDGFSHALQTDCAKQLDEQGLHYLDRVRAGAQRMARLIDDLLGLSRLTRARLERQRVDVTRLATEVGDELRRRDPERRVELVIAPGLEAHADAGLLLIMLENLLGNAWKFSAKRERARIEVSVQERDGEIVFCVRDDGAGFDMASAARLFAPFQRMHDAREFEGTGIGLATVSRIVARHGGRIWAEAAPERGAAFFFSLGEAGEARA